MGIHNHYHPDIRAIIHPWISKKERQESSLFYPSPASQGWPGQTFCCLEQSSKTLSAPNWRTKYLKPTKLFLHVRQNIPHALLPILGSKTRKRKRTKQETKQQIKYLSMICWPPVTFQTRCLWQLLPLPKGKPSPESRERLVRLPSKLFPLSVLTCPGQILCCFLTHEIVPVKGGNRRERDVV